MSTSDVIKMKSILITVFCAFSCAFATNSRVGRAFTEVWDVSNACKSFREAYGTYPPTQTWFVELTAGETSVLNKDKVVFANLMSPNDPWDTPYVYRFPGKHSPDSFDFYTLGADKVTRTDGDDRDDISSWHKPGRRYSYNDPPIITPSRLRIAGLIAAAFLTSAILRKKKKRTDLCGVRDSNNVSKSPPRAKITNEERTALFEKSAILSYYMLAMAFCPNGTLSYLIMFVITPFFASIAGLVLYRNLSERILSWLLFALSIIELVAFPGQAR